MRTKRWLGGFLVLAVLVFSFVLLPGTGAEQRNWKLVATEDVKAMLDNHEDFCLVNVLPRIIHDAAYIKGSINIPIGKVKNSPELPKDKAKPIVFYCLGKG